MANKRKIINDPVYGFISITDDLIFDIIEHSYFQRLRRIKQLGLSYFVYPGAIHTRFSHALGSMFLLQQALETLKTKGYEITEEERLATTTAILLHDVGHGPYSHSLENIFTEGIPHEQLSEWFMQEFNSVFDGQIELALKIFRNQYHKKVLHQLISSQLDIDRLDYLTRDSFFTGVSEGVIGTERILKMLAVHNDELVVDEKGIYSIEKFIISRRLMYWQVYLHKTVIAADQLLVKIIQRAKELLQRGEQVTASPALLFFLRRNGVYLPSANQKELLDKFSQLDDYDIMGAIKLWTMHEDPILSLLSKNLLDRKLPKIEIQNDDFNEERIAMLKKQFQEKYHYNEAETEYFIFTGNVQNDAYNLYDDDKINILFKSGKCLEISQASDQLDANFLSKSVTKRFLCYPKGT